MSVTKMGFEGMAYYGPAGATASTLITDAADISINLDNDTGNTTKRGDSTVPPLDTEDVTVRKASIEITMLIRTTDAVLESMRAASATGIAIAFRLKDYSDGKGFDGDVIVKTGAHSKPLRGEQTIAFTLSPTRSEGRDPQLYV